MIVMGSVGNTTNVPDRFTYQRSSDIKEWSAKEEQRTKDISKYVSDKIFEGGWHEYYEENNVETLDTYVIDGDGQLKDEEITLEKMNLVYTQNWDENEKRVKQGKAVTGSTYYSVYGEDGDINESLFAYKTKADAEHAMKLYIDERKQYIEYLKRKAGK